MRVVLLTAGEQWSGVEVHTLALARALVQRGHDAVIVELGRHLYQEVPHSLPCPLLYKDLGHPSSPVVPLGNVSSRTWFRLFRSLAADIGITVKGTFQFGSPVMDAVARICFSRYLVIEHMHAPLGIRKPSGPSTGKLPGVGLWWYRRKFSGYLRSLFPHRTICVSRAVASTLRNDYSYPSSKLVAVHSGVDTALFQPNPRLRQETRELLGIPAEAFVFGTLGRLSPMKNHGQLLSAFSQLCRQANRRDLRLIIAGDGPLRSSLEAMAIAKGVRELILFHGFTETPERIYPSFDVFCLPSLGEALGIALLEAMSCGCPPIAADVGGIPEVLREPCPGWLIPAGDERALLSTMALAEDSGREELRQRGVAARERVVREFNADTLWPQLVAVVEGNSVPVTMQTANRQL